MTRASGRDAASERRGEAMWLGRPRAALERVHAYRPARVPPSTVLKLDANEGRLDAATWEKLADVCATAAACEGARRYPSAGELEAVLAARLEVAVDEVMVTAGGDEAIDRVCRGYLGEGSSLVTTAPSFEMISTYAKVAGAEVRAPQWWEGPAPIDEMRQLMDDTTGVVAIVSPNNPTGSVASEAELAALAAARDAAAPRAALMVDLAYTEFAATDLTRAALAIPGAVIIRTFSKAWGLAGLRVGYAAGDAAIIATMRKAGGPFAVSSLSIAMVQAMLAMGEAEAGLEARVGQTRREVRALSTLLNSLGAAPMPSEGNFVLARFGDAMGVAEALARAGVSVRGFGASGLRRLAESLRITCPADDGMFERLCAALRTAAGEAMAAGRDDAGRESR